MSKSFTLNWHRKAEDGTTFETAGTANVLEDGIFSMRLDERLVRPASEIVSSKVHLYPGRGTNSTMVRAETLRDIKQFVGECIESYLKCEATKERVILYAHDIQVAFWKQSDGTIAPNGQIGKTGGWYRPSTIHATNRTEFYRVGLAAAIFEKQTFKRPTGKNFKYRELGSDDFKEGSYGAKLASWVGITVNEDTKGVVEIPYTEEAAAFFNTALVNLCRLAEQVQSFFGDKRAIQNAIADQKEILLLQPPPVIR